MIIKFVTTQIIQEQIFQNYHLLLEGRHEHQENIRKDRFDLSTSNFYQ